MYCAYDVHQGGVGRLFVPKGFDVEGPQKERGPDLQQGPEQTPGEERTHPERGVTV